MTRNKHFRSVFAALLCAVLCMTAFATVAYADGGDYYDDELPPETWQEETQPEDNTIAPGTPFTEDGIAATRDLLYDKHTNKQFITVETRNGHTLYMELSSSDKERIQHQYDALAKKTLVGEAKSYRRTLAKRAAREVTFSDLSESELAQLFTTDEYKSDYFRFQVSGFDVLVKNELLAEALNALPERKRDIVLLSYFLDMSDAEIGELLNVVRTTVFRHRKSALAKIKQYLEGKADDEHR